MNYFIMDREFCNLIVVQNTDQCSNVQSEVTLAENHEKASGTQQPQQHKTIIKDFIIHHQILSQWGHVLEPKILNKAIALKVKN